jgi:hypothetical protein
MSRSLARTGQRRNAFGRARQTTETHFSIEWRST